MDCVPSWLLSLLMDEKSRATTEQEFPVITKKIRDESWGNFRRSSQYMSIKTMLQHSLTVELGADAGKTVYKLLMLKFIVESSEGYTKTVRFDIDLMSQMMAKLARRIEKVNQRRMTADNEDLRIRIVDEAKQRMKLIWSLIDKRIKEMQNKEKAEAHLSILKNLDFERDICHRMAKLKTFFEEREKSEQDTDVPMTTPKSVSYERHFEFNSRALGIPGIERVEAVKLPIDQRIFWIDFERIILYKCKIQETHLTSVELRRWAFAYCKYAEEKYKGNPLLSRMLLVRLKLVAMLDHKEMQQHTILREHHSGVDRAIVNYLLLPHSEDMRIAHELEQYFFDRNDGQTDPSLIGQKTVGEASFAVKFAKNNLNVHQVRGEIMAHDKVNVAAKQKEWDEAVKTVEKQKQVAQAMNCENVRRRNRSVHVASSCKRCGLLQQATNVSVKEYEHLL